MKSAKAADFAVDTVCSILRKLHGQVKDWSTTSPPLWRALSSERDCKLTAAEDLSPGRSRAFTFSLRSSGLEVGLFQRNAQATRRLVAVRRRLRWRRSARAAQAGLLPRPRACCACGGRSIAKRCGPGRLHARGRLRLLPRHARAPRLTRSARQHPAWAPRPRAASASRRPPVRPRGEPRPRAAAEALAFALGLRFDSFLRLGGPCSSRPAAAALRVGRPSSRRA